MARDKDDSLVLIGDAWVWLSDVGLITHSSHRLRYGIPTESPLTKSVVWIDAMSCYLEDEREPGDLARDITNG